MRNVVKTYLYKAVFYSCLLKHVTRKAVYHCLSAEIADKTRSVGKQLVAYDSLVDDADVLLAAAYKAFCIVEICVINERGVTDKDSRTSAVGSVVCVYARKKRNGVVSDRARRNVNFI